MRLHKSHLGAAVGKVEFSLAIGEMSGCVACLLQVKPPDLYQPSPRDSIMPAELAQIISRTSSRRSQEMAVANPGVGEKIDFLTFAFLPCLEEKLKTEAWTGRRICYVSGLLYILASL